MNDDEFKSIISQDPHRPSERSPMISTTTCERDPTYIISKPVETKLDFSSPYGKGLWRFPSALEMLEETYSRPASDGYTRVPLHPPTASYNPPIPKRDHVPYSSTAPQTLPVPTAPTATPHTSVPTKVSARGISTTKALLAGPAQPKKASTTAGSNASSVEEEETVQAKPDSFDLLFFNEDVPDLDHDDKIRQTHAAWETGLGGTGKSIAMRPKIVPKGLRTATPQGKLPPSALAPPLQPGESDMTSVLKKLKTEATATAKRESACDSFALLDEPAAGESNQQKRQAQDLGEGNVVKKVRGERGDEASVYP